MTFDIEKDFDGRYKKVLEECGFSQLSITSWDGKEKHLEMQMYTPCGEDWWVYVDFKNIKHFVDAFVYVKDCFDPDEECEMYIEIRGKKGVPNSIRELIDDQDWKLAKLEEVAEKLKEVEKNGLLERF